MGRVCQRAKLPVFAPLLESFLKLIEFRFLVIVQAFTNHSEIMFYNTAYFRPAPLADLVQSPVRVTEDLSYFGLLSLGQVEIARESSQH